MMCLTVLELRYRIYLPFSALLSLFVRHHSKSSVENVYRLVLKLSIPCILYVRVHPLAIPTKCTISN
jgi:hypothetical protein